MATQSCLSNIQQKIPPTYCGEDHCGRIQGRINEYCTHNGIGADVPVPQFNGTTECWCCCSCMAWGTPIEVSKGNFRIIESIVKGDTVLATGGKLDEWIDREVSGVGGIAPGVPLDFCYTAKFLLADGTTRLLTSTADHLYLVPGGRIQAVQDLRPGDKVMQADGGEATIEFVAPVEFSGGVRNFALGEFDPNAHPDDPFKGHLVNTFGIVSADLAVQIAYFSDGFKRELVANTDRSIAPIGSRQFFEAYDVSAYQSFVTDPQQWPTHVKAIASPLFNIPPSASSYFTEAQSNDLLEANSETNIGNSQAIANFKYLKKLFEGFHRNIYYVPDWTEDRPNAWHFNEMGQDYIIFSGGLLRLPKLSVPGLSIIASHLVAQSQGFKPIGEADYQGIVRYFRYVWFNGNFFTMFNQGIEQIKSIFALIHERNHDERTGETGRRPSLQCRLDTLVSGAAFGGVPECAKTPAGFSVATAESSSLRELTITFSEEIYADSAANSANYEIDDSNVSVEQVRVSKGSKDVTLIVKGMRSATSYLVTVKNVFSERGKQLERDGNSVGFTTP